MRRKIGAVCWLLGLQWFAAQAIAQAAWRTPYSLTGNLIDDLGAVHCGLSRVPGFHSYVCSPLHDVMNGSFVLLGSLTVAGLLLLWDIWPRRRLATGGVVWLVFFGFGMITAGLAPEDVDFSRHNLGLFYIAGGGAGILLLGLISVPAKGWQAAVSIAVAASGMAGFALLVIAPGLGAGTLERLADYPLPVWLAVLGALELAGGRTRQAGRAKTVTNDSVGIDQTPVMPDE